VTVDELSNLLSSAPPAGILVEFEGGLEDALVSYARGQGYSELHLPEGKALWVSGP
jgi:hypothetical protein